MRFFPAIAAAVCGLLIWVEAGAAPAPLEVLFGELESHRVRLSPDGKRLATAFLYGEKGEQRVGLAVVDIATKESRTIVRQADATVGAFSWAGDDRLLVTLYGTWGRVGLYAFNSQGKDMCEILPLALVDAGDPRMLLRHVSVIHTNHADESVLVARGPRIGAQPRARAYLYGGLDPSPGVYRIDTRSGKFSVVAKDPGRTMRWAVDRAGRVRVAWGFDAAAFKPDGSLVESTKFPRPQAFWMDETGAAKPLEGVVFDVNEEVQPIGFDPTGELFLFSGRQGGDRAAVYAYNQRTGKIEGPVVASDTVEISAADAVFSPHDNTVTGIVVQEGKPRVVWFDAKLKALASEIDAALPEFVNLFVGWSRDAKRVLVWSRSAKEPGRYYLYDEVAGTLEEVFARSRELRKYPLVDNTPVAIRARDGVTLHGFLARPANAPAGKPVPLVVWVHGGPWMRDTADYDPIVQFFATRGYGVLRVNFRGSIGYGRTFEELGRGQFGTGMIDDVMDAADWAVREGVARADRLAIGGASYGGYAVLRALTREPGKFKAGIALLPVADVPRQINDYKRKGYQLAHAHWVRWWAIRRPASRR